MFNWYILFNKPEFIATGLVSFKGTVNIQGIGTKEFLVTQGNLISVVYDGVLLSIELNQKNPFRIDDKAVWQDENNNIWLGIYSES